MDRKIFLEQLDTYINYIFDNERDFINRFFPTYNIVELINIYFATESIHVSFLIDNGPIAMYYARTEKFFEWYDKRINEALK